MGNQKSRLESDALNRTLKTGDARKGIKMTTLDSTSHLNAKDGVITITGYFGTTSSNVFTLIGKANAECSLPSSITHQRENSFSLNLKEGKKEGLLAILVHTGNLAHATLNRVYTVEEKEGFLKIDTRKPFIPSPDRLIQFYQDGTLTVKVGDVFFVNQCCNELSEFEQRLVTGDLLCEYALGEISEKDLEKAAQEILEKTDKDEETKEIIRGLMNEVEDLKQKLAAEAEYLEALKEKAEFWKDLANELKDVLLFPFWKFHKEYGCGKGDRGGRYVGKGVLVERALKKFPSDSVDK